MALRSGGVRLLLIRHGEALCNERNIIAGEHGCRGLTAKGHRQAAGVAQRLADEQREFGVSAVYTTPVARAVQTGRPIADALGVPLTQTFPAPVYGAAEGRTWGSVLAGFEPPLATCPDMPIAPGADSWSGWVHRVGEAVDELAERHHGETVVVVGHRESIIAIEQHFQQCPATLEYATAQVDHTSITEWKRQPLGNTAHERWRWERLRHNDIAHMALDLVG